MMKALTMLLVIFILTVALVFSVSCTLINSNSAAEDKEEAAIRKAIKEASEVSFWVAVQEFKGSFEQGMEENTKIFMEEFFKQNLSPAGPVVVIFYNAPRETPNTPKVEENELRWELGFSVAKDAKVSEPLKTHQVKYEKAARYLYRGPFENLSEVYDKVVKLVDDTGYKILRPIIQRHLTDPSKVKPEELETEILIPLDEK